MVRMMPPPTDTVVGRDDNQPLALLIRRRLWAGRGESYPDKHCAIKYVKLHRGVKCWMGAPAPSSMQSMRPGSESRPPYRYLL